MINAGSYLHSCPLFLSLARQERPQRREGGASKFGASWWSGYGFVWEWTEWLRDVRAVDAEDIGKLELDFLVFVLGRIEIELEQGLARGMLSMFYALVC